MIQSTAGTAGTVTNLGTWEKTGNSSGNDTISVAFSTTNGTVSVQAGTLNLSGGGTDTGATYSGAGTIDFGGGTRTLDATSSITANALFSGSETTTVNGTYNAASTDVSGGTASLAGTVTGLGATTISGGTLNLNGASTTATSLTESSGTLSGTGTLTVSGATSFFGQQHGERQRHGGDGRRRGRQFCQRYDTDAERPQVGAAGHQRDDWDRRQQLQRRDRPEQRRGVAA